MTFLNPTILWGLLALSVPIIVHFFNLQRPRQILFSNVSLVKEVKKSVVRRMKFKQWLILLSRLLAITALVLAFAQPVRKLANQQVLGGNRSIALVIDNSYSMQASNERGAYFAQATSLVRNIVKAYGQDDEFLVMTTSDLRMNANFSGSEEALQSLRNLEIHQNIRSHEELLQFRNEMFSRASFATHELYFLSDFQQSTVMQDSLNLSIEDSSLLIKYIPVATRAQKNVYIQDHTIRSKVLEVNKPVEMSMNLVNDGEGMVNELSVRVVIDDKVAAISNKNLGGKSTEALDLTFTPNKSGWIGGFIELDDNPIDFDNRRYFSLYVPEQEKVLLVESERSENVRILYEDLFSSFEIKTVPFRNLSTIDLNEYRAMVMVGINEMASGLAEKIRGFTEAGGSLMFFPGQRVNVNALNTFLQQMEVGKIGAPISHQDGVLASVVDLQHPIFDGIYSRNQKNRSFDAPKVFQHYPIQLSSARIQNRIISLQNQDPLLVETEIGSGRMYLFSVFPGDAWTDLHVKTIFTPLLFRATQLMSQAQLVSKSQEIGAYTPSFLRTNEQTRIDLVDAEGRSFTPDRINRPGGTMLIFDNMDLKEGIYDILQGEERVEKIAFNASDLESNLSFLSASGLEAHFAERSYGNIQILEGAAESIEDQIRQEKEGVSLWKYFLMAGLLALLVEIILLRVKE
ncbi:MAG: BatA domain-containing protein [Bacteroidota bacterium]